MIAIGSRWYSHGQHWTALDRQERTTRDGIVAPMIQLVPDAEPGKPRKAKPVDWVEEERLYVLIRDRRLVESGG